MSRLRPQTLLTPEQQTLWTFGNRRNGKARREQPLQ